MDHDTAPLCSDFELAGLVSLISQDAKHAERALDEAIRARPADPRLRFLRGSLLAGDQDYVTAMAEIRKAIELDPDYAIARFQLGLLHLTSGEAAAALSVWGPLAALAPRHPLRLFAGGLEAMIADRFDEAVARLEEGIDANRDNEPLNRDMRMVVAEMRGRQSSGSTADDPLSSTQLLLRQSSIRPTRH